MKTISRHSGSGKESTTILFIEKNLFKQFMLRHPEVGITALKLMASACAATWN